MGRLVNVSIKVPKETRELMKKVNVNWSGYLREVIEAKIRMEMAKEAASTLDRIRERANKLPTGELVRWIREDRARSLK